MNTTPARPRNTDRRLTARRGVAGAGSTMSLSPGRAQAQSVFDQAIHDPQIARGHIPGLVMHFRKEALVDRVQVIARPGGQVLAPDRAALGNDAVVVPL